MDANRVRMGENKGLMRVIGNKGNGNKGLLMGIKGYRSFGFIRSHSHLFALIRISVAPVRVFEFQ